MATNEIQNDCGSSIEAVLASNQKRRCVYGQPHVAWGDFARFVAYTGKLNWFVPAILLPALAWASTFAEILLGFALVVGLFTRIAALLSGMIYCYSRWP